MWYQQHGDKLDWYHKLAAEGISPKALQSKPILDEIEEYYLYLYNMCDGDKVTMCALNNSMYHLNASELQDAIIVISLVNSGVNNANDSP